MLSPRVLANSAALYAASILPRLALLQKLIHDVAVEAVRVYGAALADRHLPHGLEFRATRSARARSRGRSSSIRLSARGSCSSPCRRCAYKRLVTTDRRRSMLAALLKAIYEMATPSTDEICDVTALKARFRSISRSSNPCKIRGTRTRRARPRGGAQTTCSNTARASDGVQVAPGRDRRAVRALRILHGFQLRELLCDGAESAVTSHISTIGGVANS